MANKKEILISWTAPIIPSHSLAGIPLGLLASEFESSLEKYLIDPHCSTYKFEGSPELVMEKHIDLNGNGGFGFGVCNLELTNWRLYYDSPNHPGVNPNALTVIVRSWKVYAVKVWQFESTREGELPVYSYQGKAPIEIGLGNYVKDLLSFSNLAFDNSEEWFYTDSTYGGLEVTGLGADIDLQDDSEQRISALCVICATI